MHRAVHVSAFIVLLAVPLPTSAQPAPMDAAGVYKHAAPSVVIVEGATSAGTSQGSGVVVADGQVVTNNHVVRGTTGFVLIRQGKKTWRAEVEAVDEEHDLATLGVVLRRAETFDLPPVKKRGSWTLSVGEKVYAIGSPRGLERTLSDGLISGLPKVAGSTVVQTTAAISPGSSGGGLFDKNGALVGITTLYFKESQSLNFAVSVDDVFRLQKSPPRWAASPYTLEPPAPSLAAPASALPASPSRSSGDSNPELPAALSAVTAVVVMTTATGPVATAGGMTDEWIETYVTRKLRNKGIWVFSSSDEAVAAKKLALPIFIAVDSLNIEDTALYPWRITVAVIDAATHTDGVRRPITLWSDGTYGYGGSQVVLEQVSGALDDKIDELAAVLGRDGAR